MKKIAIDLNTVIKKFNLQIINPDDTNLVITKPTVSRAGLSLAAYLHPSTVKNTVIAWSSQENNYFDELGEVLYLKRIEKILELKPALIILCAGMGDDKRQPIIDLAIRHNTPICNTWMRMSDVQGSIGNYLNYLFSPSYQVHGTLMKIFDLGVLIIGDSGVGKSEAALELIQKGHILVSDDAVIVSQNGDRIVGTAPAITRYFLEARGLGFIDILEMYGYKSVAKASNIDLVVELKIHNNSENYDFDRIGDKNLSYVVYNVKIPLMEIPVRVGRSISSLIEAAANVQILKSHGHDALSIMQSRIRKENDE